MKTIEKNIKSLASSKLVSKSTAKRQNQPFLEQKLEEVNQLLKKVGLPKELEK
ncbi:hypothetical protein [Emticicia fontis]